MPVYLIRAGEHGPVKVGFSDDVAARLVKMQADNHERLTVLRIFTGAETEEKALHIRFADLRLHGEWFAYSRLMVGDVGLVEIEAPSRVGGREVKAQRARREIVESSVDHEFGARLKTARRAAGLTQTELADAIRSDHSDISHYENGHYSPSLAKLTALAEAVGVTVAWLMGETPVAA